MSKYVRKLVTSILLVVLSFAVLPLCAFADEPTNTNEPLKIDEPRTSEISVSADYHDYTSPTYESPDDFIGPIDPATITAVICSHIYQISYSSAYTYHDITRHVLTVYKIYNCINCGHIYQIIDSETSGSHIWQTTTTDLIHTYSNGVRYHSYDIITYCNCTQIKRREPVINVICNCAQ